MGEFLLLSNKNYPHVVDHVGSTESGVRRHIGERHHGKSCRVLSAVSEDDGEAFDPRVAKTWVELEDGTKIALPNDAVKI